MFSIRKEKESDIVARIRRQIFSGGLRGVLSIALKRKFLWNTHTHMKLKKTVIWDFMGLTVRN